MRKLSESVWGNISKRAEGTLDRKEDDINHFGPEELCDYLNKTYVTQTPYDIIFDKVTGGISVCIYKVNGHYSYLRLYGFSKDKKMIQLSDLYNRHMRETLNKEFNVDDTDDYYLIEPYDNRAITNSFFIEVLDFLLKAADKLHKPCLKKKLTESVWGNISKRAEGTLDRHEDRINVDGLDVLEFYKYLRDNYEVIDTDHGLYDIKNSVSSASLVIPILKDRTYGSYYNLCYRYHPTLMKYLYMGDNCQSYYPELFKKLKKSFNVRDMDDGLHHTWITPLDGSECNNSFCVKMIEFILKNADKDDLGLSHK